MVSLVEREKSEPQIPDEKGMALFAGTRPLVSFSGLRKWDQEFESRLLQRRVRNEPDPLAAGTPVNTPIGSVPPDILA